MPSDGLDDPIDEGAARPDADADELQPDERRAGEVAAADVQAEATPQAGEPLSRLARLVDAWVIAGPANALALWQGNPPLRTEADRLALIEALRSGVVDCIGTDHAPHAINEKNVPFEEANMGVIGLETAFPVLYTELVEPGVIDLGLLVERMGAGAELFDLDPSTIAVDAEANIALVDLDAEWEAGADGWESRSSNSCFNGRAMRSRILMTIIGGAVAFRRRRFAVRAA